MKLNSRSALLLMLPATVLYALFVLYPAIESIQLSLTNARGLRGGSFVGLANYRALLHDPQVTAALKNTLIYTVFVVVVQNALGLAVAAWLYSHPKIRTIARTGMLLPAMMALVAVSYLWQFIYSPIGGPLNAILGGLGLQSLEQSWLGNPSTALASIAATYMWMYLGYTATIFLANYLAIPASVLEAASLDGATGWRRFKYIDWRLLAPSLTVNVTLSTIGSLRVFDLPFVMTNGGPGNSTQTLSYVIYTDSFQNFQFAYGTSIAVVLLVITIIASILVTTVLRRREVAA
ncbi:sugar ABC transporter permease [Actinospica sp. MGRD01-02]|uniref:Sugar ABC transporter permease n=1 Tax=Actinospica acidithermotolerans TaxID=2828514 RepID=A0A941E719_9ACTN|nr:sugar ABC transporter permease [Actinospica acidithermotolerans]MBR7825123.1 sugar ABC transporter permease [Actinospica acidithermotolerans]